LGLVVLFVPIAHYKKLFEALSNEIGEQPKKRELFRRDKKIKSFLKSLVAFKTPHTEHSFSFCLGGAAE
jgi:hypothetical protein